MDINLIINTVTYYSFLIPVTAGLLLFRQISKLYRALFFFSAYVAIQETIRWNIEDQFLDLLILNFYSIIETAFLGYLFYHLIDSNTWKKFIPIALIIVAVFFVFNLVLIEGYFDLNALSMTIESLFFIILSGRLFYQFIEKAPARSLLKNENFWFNFGVFIYFTLNFFIFMLGNRLYSLQENDIKGFHLWDIHDFLNLFLNITFAKALWFSSRKNRNTMPVTES